MLKLPAGSLSSTTEGIEGFPHGLGEGGFRNLSDRRAQPFAADAVGPAPQVGHLAQFPPLWHERTEHLERPPREAAALERTSDGLVYRFEHLRPGYGMAAEADLLEPAQSGAGFGEPDHRLRQVRQVGPAMDHIHRPW